MRDPASATDSRVLIVHDDPGVAQDLDRRLTGFGYTVVGTASTVTEAMNLEPGNRPAVMLVRLTQAGSGAATEILRLVATSVVFLTGRGLSPSALALAGLPGPFGYVEEPFPDRELRMNIEMALVRESARTRVHPLEERFFAVNIDMLCCVDFNGYFTRLNPAWERTLGFTREELMAEPFVEFVHPDDRDRTLAQNTAVRNGGKAVGFENRYRCKDGSYRWFLWNAAADDEQGLIYSVARDTTERKLAEEERERIVSELQTALAEVRTLQEILPICSYCKKIRNDENYWQTVEAYILHHTNSTFSHGICPSCYQTEVEPQFRRPKE